MVTKGEALVHLAGSPAGVCGRDDQRDSGRGGGRRYDGRSSQDCREMDTDVRGSREIGDEKRIPDAV